jgi:hypothetical protein
MKHFITTYRYHLLILFIGLLWVFGFDFLTQMSRQGIIYPDSTSYVEAAKNLYVFHRGHNYRPMLMAFINGLPYLFGGDDDSLIAFSFYVNLFCWLAFLLVFFEMLKELLLPKKAFFLTLFAMFFIGNVAHVFHLLTESIFMLFMIVGFFCMMKYYKNREFRYLALAMGIFILSMLIKPGAKFFAIVFAAFFIPEIIRNYKSKAMWWLCGCLTLVLVQCTGIKHQFGNFTLSYIDAVTYYDYLGSKAMCLKFGKEYSQMNNPRAEYIFSHECYEQKRIAGEDLKAQLCYNTKNLAKAYISDVMENTKTGNTCIDDCSNIKGNSSFPFWKSVLYGISKWQNRIFTLLGVVLSLFFVLKRYRQRDVFFFMALFTLYIYATAGISCSQGDRFHVITFPLVVLLAVKFLKDK